MPFFFCFGCVYCSCCEQEVVCCVCCVFVFVSVFFLFRVVVDCRCSRSLVAVLDIEHVLFRHFVSRRYTMGGRCRSEWTPSECGSDSTCQRRWPTTPPTAGIWRSTFPTAGRSAWGTRTGDLEGGGGRAGLWQGYLRYLLYVLCTLRLDEMGGEGVLLVLDRVCLCVISG